MSGYLGNFGYRYNAGANVVIAINDQTTFEAVGISYNVMDSVAPIYGYSSRLFDAVAPGQKLIQGSFVVNYVAPNYVFAMAKKGAQRERDFVASSVKANLSPQDVQLLGDAQKKRTETIKKIQSAKMSEDYENALREAAIFKEHFWGEPEPGYSQTDLVAYDPTLMGPNRIQILFGGPTRSTAKHLIEIHGVYIIGHGSAIQADENVVLEEYNFIGRELVQAALTS